jgi:hypothetical protein
MRTFVFLCAAIIFCFAAAATAAATILMISWQMSLPFESVQSVCEDANGTVLAVTENSFLARRAADKWQTISTNSGWSSGRATYVTVFGLARAISI